MKTIYFIIALIIIVILAGFCVYSNAKMLQYKKVIDYNFPPSEEEVSVMGEITDIQNNIISIKTTITDFYLLPKDWKTKIIKVTVNEQTQITKSDFETGQSTKINLSDIKIGDRVNARTDENIKDKSEFTAKYIEVFTAPKE
jgi:hypothetical protein